MKLALPKLTASDTLGISTVLGVGVFAIAHYALKLDDTMSGVIAAGVTGLLGYAIPDAAIAGAAAPLDQLVEDSARAIATKQIAQSIPKLTTDALATISAFMAAHAQAIPQINVGPVTIVSKPVTDETPAPATTINLATGGAV